MNNNTSITSVRARLIICHSPLTWKDTLTWDKMPMVTFASFSDFQEWVKELLNGPTLEGGSYIEYWRTQEDGSERWSTCKYAYWNQYLLGNDF
jgi:hypothetical protein